MAKKKKSDLSEEQELENAFRNMTGNKPVKKEKRSSGVTIVICIAIAAIIIGLGGAFFYMVHTEMNRVIAGDVTIAGVHLQGMTQKEAIAAVDAAFTPKAMTVTVLDHSVQLPADCVTGLSTRKAVRAACNLGKTASPQTLDLAPYLKVDEDRLQGILAELGNYYNTTLTESTYEVVGTAPAQTLKIKLGTPQYGLDLIQLQHNVLTAYGMGKTTLEGQCTLLEPKTIDLDAIWKTHCRDAVNAHYDVRSKKLEGGDEGYGFDMEAAKAALAEAEYGAALEFPFTAISPAITREAAEAELFKDVLGTFTAKSSSQKNRDVNLGLACKAINGITLYPGDSFSYNETLGERTPEKGYKPAGTYIGNETVNTYGGGICQVSSSLYYSVLCAELEIIERTNHGFLPSYMPRGLDATVNWGTLDFKFRNNQDYPIRIEATAKGGTTTITVYGTETRNYRVKLAATVIYKTPYETEYQVMEANNKGGYKNGDVIVSPHSGYYVESYIYKYELDSDKLISKDYIDDSRYRVRNKVVCKIEGTTTPDQPGGGTDTPTEPGGTTTPDIPGGETPTPPPVETPPETPTP